MAYAYMAEHIFKLPVFYVEYSGTYGDPDLVRQTKEQLNHTLLFYGGGIENLSQAIEMKKNADAIIVGNSIYTDIENALRTVEAIKGKREFNEGGVIVSQTMHDLLTGLNAEQQEAD